MKRLYYFLSICCYLAAPPAAHSQNIENFNAKKDVKDFFKGFYTGDPFTMSGDLGLNTRSYYAVNAENRQAPFTWYLNGRLNISIYKIKIPLSVLLAAQNQTASHPFRKETIDNLKNRRFARVGASPYYKWAKLHLGHRNMNFSPMTVANHTFLGAGLELTPGNIRFATFYGGMAKTEPRDLAILGLNREIFNRKGFGLKAGYGTSQHFIDFILFKAKDDPSQIAPINQDTTTIFRNENAVLGLNGQAIFFKKLKFKMELATSGLTKNSLDPESDGSRLLMPSALLPPRTSTVYRKAINAGFDYQLKIVTLGMAYKRVEPDYRTLGAYFFNDDLEDYTLNLGFGLLENRLRIMGNGGIQRNNLFDDKASQYNRAIGAVNITYSLKTLNLGLNYSNNSSSVDYVLNADLDSLNAVVVTQSSGLNASYTLISENKDRHIFSSNFAMQQVTDAVEDPNRSAASQMLNGVVSYAFSPKEAGWKYNVRLNYNRNELSRMLINRYGLSLGVERQLIPNKWSFALSTNYYYSDGKSADNQTLNLRLSSPIRINKQQRIDLGLGYLNRIKSGNTTGAGFQEYIGTINYVYSFTNSKKTKKDKTQGQ